jgi:hypothetical protein
MDNRWLPAAAAALGCLLAAPEATAQRQPPSQDELVARKEAKLKEEWVKNAAWTFDYDEARARAKKEGKLIFAYFTRSYSP